MCGLTAFSRSPHSSIPDGRRAILASLLAIEDRGPHSCGVGWTRGKAEKVWYHRVPGTASKVAGELDLSGRARIHSMIGHTRYATQGAHDYDNAHPVVADNIVLAHNGICTNDDELVELAGIKRPEGCEVDSFAIAAILSAAPKLGFTVTEALELVEGDFALAWIDSHDPATLHLARGNGRPLAIGFTKRGDLLMASTPANLKRWSSIIDVDVVDIQQLAVGTYLQVRQGGIDEWTEFTPAAEQRRQAVVQASLTGLPRPLWNSPYKRGNPRKRRRSHLHGITDLVANRPDDWWDEAERLLGDAVHDQ